MAAIVGRVDSNSSDEVSPTNNRAPPSYGSIEEHTDNTDNSSSPVTGGLLTEGSGGSVNWWEWLVIFVVGLIFFVDNFGATIIMPILPDIEGLTPFRGSAILSAYGLLYVFGLWVAAPIMRVCGKVQVMLGCSVLLCIAALIISIWQNFVGFFLARLLQGLASSINDMAANSFLCEQLHSRSSRVVGFGATSALCNLGLMLGPITGGLLMEGSGGSVKPLAVALSCVFAFEFLIVGSVLVSGAGGQQPQRGDQGGPEQLALVTGSEADETFQNGRDDEFSCCESLHRAVTNRAVLLANCSIIFVWGGTYALCASVPWHFQIAHGLSSTTSGIAVSILYAASAFTAPFVGAFKWLQTHPLTAIIFASSFEFAAAVLFAVDDRQSLEFVALGLTGISIGFIVPIAKFVITKEFDGCSKEQLDTQFSIYFSCQGIVMVVGPLLGGLPEAIGWENFVLLFAAVEGSFMVIGTVLVLCLTPCSTRFLLRDYSYTLYSEKARLSSE